eukprot:7591224-Pyramimonas_sp.AAC.1
MAYPAGPPTGGPVSLTQDSPQEGRLALRKFFFSRGAQNPPGNVGAPPGATLNASETRGSFYFPSPGAR